MIAQSCMMLLFLLLSLSCVLGQSSSSSSTGSSPSSVPIITRISGCQDVDNITTNCVRAGMTLTIHGSGLKPGNYKYYSVRLDQFNQSFDVSVSSINDTHIVTRSAMPKYGLFMNNELVNVTLNYPLESREEVDYAWFVGMSFMEPVPLFVSHVTGCPVISSDGRTASQCNLTSDQIVVVGSGFSSIYSSGYVVTIGSRVTEFDIYSGPRQIINDTHMIWFWNDINSLAYLPLPVQAYDSNVDITISSVFNSVPWSLNTFYIGFATLPSFVISGLKSTNKPCVIEDPVGGFSRYSECYPGRTRFQIGGYYFWQDTQVWINGVAAEMTMVAVCLVVFVIPVMEYDPDVYYDIQIVNRVSSVTLNGIFKSVRTPQIASISPCVQKLASQGESYYKAYCLENEIFSFAAVNIGSLPAPRVWFGPYECMNVQVIKDRTILCTVPRDPDGEASVRDNLYMSWPTYNSSAMAFELWDPPGSPRILSVTGSTCYRSSDATQPLQCLDEPGVLTLIGSFGYGTRAWRPVIWSWDSAHTSGRGLPCRVLSLSNDNTTLTCQLTRDFLSLNTPYELAVSYTPDNNVASNVMLMSYVSKITYDPSPSKSSVTIALAVVLPIIAVMIVVAVVYLKRRQTKRSNLSSTWDSSSDNVELA